MTVDSFFQTHTTVVLFDSEYTSWEGSHERGWSEDNEHREIVQIAAVKVDLKDEKVIDRFNVFVIHRIHRELSAYFVALTGVTQEIIENEGLDFEEAYASFLEWAGELPLFSYGNIPLADGEVVKENIELYNLSVPFEAEKFKTIRPLFSEAGIDTEKYSSGMLHTVFDLPVEGGVHDARHDAESLAVSLLALKNGKQL